MVYIYIYIYIGRKLVERDLVLMVGVTYFSCWIKNGDFPLFFQLIFLTTNMCTYKWRPSRSTATTHLNQPKQAAKSTLNLLSTPVNKKQKLCTLLCSSSTTYSPFSPLATIFFHGQRIYMNNSISISISISISLLFTLFTIYS